MTTPYLQSFIIADSNGSVAIVTVSEITPEDAKAVALDWAGTFFEDVYDICSYPVGRDAKECVTFLAPR
jgi:hypothetical protein